VQEEDQFGNVTTTAETVSVLETTAMVSGQTMNLQSLIVRVIP